MEQPVEQRPVVRKGQKSAPCEYSYINQNTGAKPVLGPKSYTSDPKWA